MDSLKFNEDTGIIKLILEDIRRTAEYSRDISEIVIDIKVKCQEAAYKHEGRQGQQWILIDYVNVVIHVMLPEPRKFYQLEEMWSDAVLMEHRD